MRLICERCLTKYSIEDRLIPARGARAQCPRCRHTQIVRRAEGDGAASSLAGGAGVPPLGPSSDGAARAGAAVRSIPPPPGVAAAVRAAHAAQQITPAPPKPEVAARAEQPL